MFEIKYKNDGHEDSFKKQNKENQKHFFSAFQEHNSTEDSSVQRETERSFSKIKLLLQRK